MGRVVCRLLCLLALWLAVPWAPAQPVPKPVVVLALDGAIGPASEDYLRRGLAMATREQAQLLVLQLDTPGGLDTAMRAMIKDILASPVPVATFVAPGGARAASAGTYILYASHVAAMTPASTLGAATPVAIGMPGAKPSNPLPATQPASRASAPVATEDALAAKRIGDAAAYMRSLGQLRGRNADWGERAVREAVSLSAPEALRSRVVDVVASDVPDLLRQLDGRKVPVADGTVELRTRDAPVQAFAQDWRNRLLATLTNPSLALMLMMIGLYGLVFEFSNPGLIAPGVIGAICLVVALFALEMLPVNHAGLALVLLGLCFLGAEAFVPTSGVLGAGGLIAFAVGCVILIDSDSPGWGVPLPLVAGLALLSAAFVVAVGGMAARARRRPVVTGLPALVGVDGELEEYAGGEGWALVQGEHWKVRGPDQLHVGDRIRVAHVRDGLLEVVPA
ncbi:NfeD family protein [Ramlibacter algicola]|uniref:Nodulation protein NfeD n=1 Tax=Ramlibacter algicola TaxID=2795217 RepID=A0A934Q3L4_9BURK|nr:nodulation protein NfeD [Ramlibacter algicola]MBK0393644.1 nodulation protein NfeD [Ramlibacter algicola]